MKHQHSSGVVLLALALAALTGAPSLRAASINMDDPHRALGREGAIRIDAQLASENVSSGSAIAVTYQVQNQGKEPVAIADRMAAASYDPETLTITMTIGSEVPPDGRLPHMSIVAPGETKVFRVSATPAIGVVASRGRFSSVPRLLQIKVALMRDIAPFKLLLDRPSSTLPDTLFDAWFDSTDMIFLNTLPVHFDQGRPASAGASAAERGSF